jgi:hypothetical protein
MKKLLLILTLSILTFSALAQEVNPLVTQANIKQTICVSGWAAKIRPPVAFTSKVKRKQLNAAIALGLYPTTAAMQDFELDHVLPLSSGGAPSSLKNLVLQPWTEATKKDAIENLVHRRICSGRITLAQGQQVFIVPNAWKTYK